MKAVSFAAPRQVHVIDVPEPTMGPEDVLLDIHYVGLCGSDLNTYRGSFSLVSYPLNRHPAVDEIRHRIFIDTLEHRIR